jgi:photosystem II stability/assembly factor-like uncharacterized protein
MNDDLERRLREALRSASLPDAPPSLRNSLPNLPGEDQVRARTARPSIAWLVPALAAGLLAVALLGVLAPSRPTPVPSGSARPTQARTATPTLGAASPIDDAGIFGSSGLWAARGTSLYLSNDRGISWVHRNLVGSVALDIDAGYVLSDLFVLDADHLWTASPGPGSTPWTGQGPPIDALHLVINRTSDGGRTWQSTALLGDSAGTQPVLAFTDPMHGFLLLSPLRFGPGESTLLATGDGGATWQVDSHDGMLGSIFSTTDATTLWAGNQGDAGPVARPILQVSGLGVRGIVYLGRTWTDARLPGLVDDTFANDVVAAGPLVSGSDGVVAINVGSSANTPETRFYSSADAGLHWTLTTTTPPTTAVALIEPSHFVTSGPAPRSLSSTTDAGATWESYPSSGLPGDPFGHGRLRFWDSESGMAIVRLGDTPAPNGLFLTHNGGRAWSPVGFPSAPASPTPIASPEPTAASVTTSANAIAYFDSDHGLLAESRGSDGGSSAGVIWRTTDGGKTWMMAAQVPVAFTSLAVVGAGEAWAGVNCGQEVSPCAGSVWASTDAGTTWQQVSTTAVESLTFADHTHGWAIQSGPAPGPGVGDLLIQLLVTTDGGRTWTPTPNPCASGIGWPVAAAFPDASHGWVGCTLNGASTNAKGVMATEDGGKTWTVRSAARIPGEGASVGTIDFGDYMIGLAMRPDGKGIWWGGRGVTERTLDGGATWSETAAGSFDVRIPSSASLGDDRHWFVVLWDGDLGSQVLVETRDGGETWNRLVLLPPQ